VASAGHNSSHTASPAAIASSIPYLRGIVNSVLTSSPPQAAGIPKLYASGFCFIVPLGTIPFPHAYKLPNQRALLGIGYVPLGREIIPNLSV